MRRAKIFLPLRIRDLNCMGVCNRQISIVIANGTRRPLAGGENHGTTPARAALEEFQMYNHNCPYEPRRSRARKGACP